MPLLETFALTITTALAKHMLAQWLGSSWETQVGQDFLDLLRDAAGDKSTNRREAKQIDAIAATIVSQMDPWVKAELRNLGEDERRAALIEASQTLALARIDAKLLVSQRLNPDRLVGMLMASQPTAAELLSEPAASLYDRLIDQSARAMIDNAHALPDYRVAADVAHLA